MTIGAPDNAGPILEVSGIEKKFGYRSVLSGVTFDLEKGRQTLLLGKNGAGKSTLLKILSGLMRPTSGKIKLYQTEMAQQPNLLRQVIGIVSHASKFYKELTAEENLTFFARLRQTRNFQEKIERALQQTGLIHFSSTPVIRFSSGMLKRLNIARLMVAQPRLLLLDEPYAGLDYDSTDFFNAYLKKFKTDGGTILLISHRIETCFENSDLFLILEEGVIRGRYSRLDLSLADLIRNYQSIAT